MKYIYILLIILLIIIISYIIINNNYKEYFYNIHDGFKLISIDSSLHNSDCSDDKCDIKYIDIKYYNDNKSIYYLTKDNDIYILQATGGLSKNKLVYFEDYDITSVVFSDDYNYGFIAIKNKVDKMVKIFYSTNSIKSWNELKFDYNKNNHVTQVKDNYKQIHEVDTAYINVMSPEDVIINNLLIVYETKDGKKIPKSLIFTTKGYTKIEEENNKYLHSTELTIREIILNNNSKSFDDVLEDFDKKEDVFGDVLKYHKFDCFIHKLYFDRNYDFYILKNRIVEKIFNHNDKYIILLIKNYTELELEPDNAYELICLNENNKEIYFNFEDNEKLLNSYIIDLKYYKNNFKLVKRNFFIGVLRNKKDIIAIDLEKLDNVNTNNYLNSISLQAKNLITSGKYSNPYLFEIDYKIIEIYNNESTNIIKDFDIDYNYTEIEDNIVYELYIVTFYNEFNKQLLDINYEKIETVENIEYPNNEITFINNVLIHKKKSSTDKSSVIINNNDKLFIYRDSVWNRIDNFNVEFSNYNIQDFISKMDDPDKLTFKGENYLENKIYDFTYNKDKYVDILLVGGGGGGGYGGGGGGGGAIRYIKNMRLSKGTYIVTVGSGGEGGYLESDSSGKNGFLSSIEKNNDEKFTKIIAAGGGGGGGFNSEPQKTPTYGTIGDKDYTSGGGGGAGKEDGIGGIGNDVSGSGGSSYNEESSLYGGGGGGGSSIGLQEYHDSNGYNANNTNIGYGGKGVKLEEDIKIEDMNEMISVGGNGGYYGYIDTANERQIINKFQNHINKDINIFGKGGDGTIIFRNETPLSRQLTVRNRGNSGIVIILESNAIINDKTKKEKKSNDDFLNMYSIKDRNLQKEYDKKIDEYKLYLEDEFRKKDEKRKEMVEEKLENEKNISKIEVRDYIIMEQPRSYEKPNENPIKDRFLPYLSNVYDGEKIDENDPINSEIEYYIIKTYKDLLYRQPTRRELYDYKSKLIDKLITKNDMRQLIVNTEEYKKVTNLQTNNLNRNQLYSVEKANISYKIKKIYNEELNEDIPNYLINPLNDIFTKLYLNEYLLRAIFINEKFPRFKDDIKNNNDITPDNITEVFLKYYDMNALKDKANDIMKYFKYNKYDNKEEIKEDEKDKYSEYSEVFNEDDIKYQEELERLTLTSEYDLLYKPVDEKYDFDKEYDTYVDKRDAYTEYLNTL
jgi:hypothetical protein